jgi:hypothetical protein
MWLRIPDWFGLDDWDLLVTRTTFTWDSYFRPHFDHISVIPALVYQVLFYFFGLDSRPYQLVAILVHLAIAVELWFVLKRSRVERWLSSALIVTFIFFGAGHQNITYAFGISFSGAIALGLGQLLLADRGDDSARRRDWIAVFLGVLCVLSSNVSITMVAAVGVAVFWRRGLRPALLQVAFPAAAFVAWWLTFHTSSVQPAPFNSTAMFVNEHFLGLFFAFGQNWISGAGWIALFLVGLGVCVGARSHALVSNTILASSLVAVAPVYLISAGIGSFQGSGGLAYVWPAPRHLHVLAVLVIPVIGIGANRIVRQWRWASLLVIAFCLSGIASNLNLLSAERNTFESQLASNRPLILGAAEFGFLDQLPPTIEVDPDFSPGVTVGWLRFMNASRKIPTGLSLSPIQRSEIAARLSFRKSSYDGLSPGQCENYFGPVDLVLERGQRLIVTRGSPQAFLIWDGVPSLPIEMDSPPYFPNVREAVAGPLYLRLIPADGETNFDACVQG